MYDEYLETCWNCGHEYDLEDNDYVCPECGEYYGEESYDEDYEDEDEIELEELINNNLKNTNMNLKQLKEQPRSYKGIKSVLDYIKENYKGLEDQFTIDLIRELLREKEVCGEQSKLAVVFENRLYITGVYNIYDIRHATNNDKKSLETIQVVVELGTPVDGLEDYLNSRSIYLKDLYIITDYIEIENLKVTKLELQKEEKQKEIDELIKSLNKAIENQKTFIADIKKYNTFNKSDIRKLKALDIIRNSKATNEELLKAVKNI